MSDPLNPQPPDAGLPPQARPPVNPAGAMAPPPPPPGYYPPAPPSPRGGRAGRIFGWSVTGLLLSLLLVSIALNVYLAMFFSSVTSGPHEVTFEAGTGPGRIVILPVTGTIDNASFAFVRQSLRDLRLNAPKALILRIDSGGGFVGPSDRIYSEIKRFRAETGVPVVASFGSLAASGGYYIAAGSDWIVAEPTCTTGSIGVMSAAFTFERLLDKIGVSPVVRTATQSPMKDVANNPFRRWEQRDQDKLQTSLDNAYDRFVEVVFEGRKAHLQTREQALAVANGEFYTTQKAIDIKLVDGAGYIYDAIDKAKQLAQLSPTDDPEVTVMRAPVSLGLRNLLTSKAQPPLGLDADHVRRLLVELASPRMEYR